MQEGERKSYQNSYVPLLPSLLRSFGPNRMRAIHAPLSLANMALEERGTRSVRLAADYF